MINIAVVEDNEQDAAQLCAFIDEYAEKNGLAVKVSRFSDAVSFLDGTRGAFDLIFMDILMPGMDGMRAAQRLRASDRWAKLIFVTNMAQYAIRGYEVGALDFVVKPVRYPSFAFKFRRAVELATRRRRRSVWLQTASGSVRLDTAEILYVEVQGHRLVYHTIEGDLELWGTMKSARELLEPAGFALCNVCYLVNLERVTRLDGEMAYVDDVPLKMSRGRRKPFVDALTRSMGE